MPESFADAGPDFLQQLLDAAMRAPAAADDPATGRITANLLVALAAKHEDSRVEPYLSWGSGRRTVYEVRFYDQTERMLSSDRCASAGEAIRATGVVADQPGNTARVVAVAGDGEERWMMAVRAGAAVYRVPETAPQPEGTPSATEVVGELRELLAGMTVHVDATAIEAIVRDAVAGLGQVPAAANGSGSAVDPGTFDAMVRAVVAELAGLIPSADDIADEVTRRITTGPASPMAAARDRRSGRPPRVHPDDPAVQDALAEERPGDEPLPPVVRPRPSLPPPRIVPARTQPEP